MDGPARPGDSAQQRGGVAVEARVLGSRHRAHRGAAAADAEDDRPARTSQHRDRVGHGRSASAIDVSYGGWSRPASVTIAVTSSAGVTSNAKFAAGAPSGATARPSTWVTSLRSRSSISISAPVAVWGSMVESGAATWNGTPWRAGRTAVG